MIPEKELCFLCEISLCPVFCVFAAFCTTGFDRHTSLVFNPANPETSIEDCLAAVGDRVARELDTHLAAAVNKLLTGSVCSRLVYVTKVVVPKLILHVETELWGSVQHYSGLTTIFTLYSYSMRKPCVPTGWELQSRNHKVNVDIVLFSLFSP